MGDTQSTPSYPTSVTGNTTQGTAATSDPQRVAGTRNMSELPTPSPAVSVTAASTQKRGTEYSGDSRSVRPAKMARISPSEHENSAGASTDVSQITAAIDAAFVPIFEAVEIERNLAEVVARRENRRGDNSSEPPCPLRPEAKSEPDRDSEEAEAEPKEDCEVEKTDEYEEDSESDNYNPDLSEP